MQIDERRIVVDPVCGMDVYAAKAPFISYSGRRIYYFCSVRCKQEFDLAPQYHLDRLSGYERRVASEDRRAHRRLENRRRSVRFSTPLPA